MEIQQRIEKAHQTPPVTSTNVAVFYTKTSHTMYTINPPPKSFSEIYTMDYSLFRIVLTRFSGEKETHVPSAAMSFKECDDNPQRFLIPELSTLFLLSLPYVYFRNQYAPLRDEEPALRPHRVSR